MLRRIKLYQNLIIKQNKMKIGFIGSGKMAEAILSGILDSKIMSSKDIYCSDINIDRTEYLKNKYEVSIFNNTKLIEKCNLIFLCVKPQDIKKLKMDLFNKLNNQQTLISILAGIKISTLIDISNHESVIRVMPNTPAQIKNGVSVWSSTTQTNKEHIDETKKILNSIGQQYQVDDEQIIEMATALSASGPAYLFYFIESLIESGQKIGLSDELAHNLTIQMLKGSLNLYEFSKESAEQLRKNVTSPGGTTEAAMNVLNNKKFKDIIIEAVDSAHKRGLELGE